MTDEQEPSEIRPILPQPRPARIPSPAWISYYTLILDFELPGIPPYDNSCSRAHVP